MAEVILELKGILGTVFKLIKHNEQYQLYQVNTDIMGDSYLTHFRSFDSGTVIDVLIGHLAAGYKKE